MGLLEGYFVPLHCYNQHPSTDAERTANVQLAFNLISTSSNLHSEPIERPEDIVLGDGKAIIRLLFSVYTQYQEAIGSGGLTSDVLQEISEQEQEKGTRDPVAHNTLRNDGVAECA